MNSLSRIFTGYEYGIDFYDKNDVLIEERTFNSEDDRDATVKDLEDDDHAAWPKAAIRSQPWQRKKYRAAIYGVDYGPGSVKQRFSGMRVPRSAYRFTTG